MSQSAPRDAITNRTRFHTDLIFAHLDDRRVAQKFRSRDSSNMMSPPMQINLLTFTHLRAALLAAILLNLASCAATGSKKDDTPTPGERQQTLLDANWLFHRGDITPS